MKLIVLIHLFLFSFLAYGGSISATPSMELTWKKDINLSFISNNAAGGGLLGQAHFEGDKNRDDLMVVIRSTKAPTLAHEITVEKYWQREMKKANQMGDKSKDLGCKKVKKSLFVCKREAQTLMKTFIAETFIWNGKKEIASIRSSSKESQARANKLMKSLRWKMTGKQL